MTDTLNAETIVEMTQQIWTALLSDTGDLRPGGRGGGERSATIAITGAWNGTVCLTCSDSAVRRAAAVMFGMTEPEVGPEEMSDAIGELINVVGGNIKGILPGPTELSLPSVHEGTFDVPGHFQLGWEVQFTWSDEPVVVTVWTDEDAAVPA